MHRTATQLARRAVVMGAVAFRASVERSNDRRAPEITEWILPWLEKMGVAEDIDPIELRLLETPYKRLDKTQSIDANWSGEGAAIFCWALGTVDKPPRLAPADQQIVITTLGIMKPTIPRILNSPMLRERSELEQFCKQVRLTRIVLHETHIKDGPLTAEKRRLVSEIRRGKVTSELENAGITVDDTDFREIQGLVGNATTEARRLAAGAHVAREVAVTWLFDSRENYFDI